MADSYPKQDPFKPEQPHIPGVPRVKPGGSRSGGAIALLTGKPAMMAGAAVVAVLVIGFGVVRWSHGKPANPAPTTNSQPVAAPAEKPRPAPKPLPEGPGVVATTGELSKPWSSQAFNYRNPTTGLENYAMVVRLPEGGYWAFSLREPYGNCTLEYVTDLEKLRTMYNYAADHPMVGDPCTRSVFDLEKYGSGPGGLVRGQIVQGEAVRPPIAIDVRVKGHEVVIGQSE